MSFGSGQILGSAGSNWQATPNTPQYMIPPAQPLPGGLTLLASTGPSGFALQNGTPAILTVSPFPDTLIHRIIILSQLSVTTNETGGQINTVIAGISTQLHASGLITARYIGGYAQGIILPTQSAAVNQVAALTAGAATLWAEIWGS